MKTKAKVDASQAARLMLLIVGISVLTQWGNDEFWLYHRQNRVLQPSDYTVNVIPGSATPTANYQLSNDGQFAVEVTTRGTSHAMGDVNNMLLCAIMAAVGGWVGIWLVNRGRSASGV